MGAKCTYLYYLTLMRMNNLPHTGFVNKPPLTQTIHLLRLPPLTNFVLSTYLKNGQNFTDYFV